MNKKVLFLLSILVMLALACNLTSLPGATQGPLMAHKSPAPRRRAAETSPGAILNPPVRRLPIRSASTTAWGA